MNTVPSSRPPTITQPIGWRASAPAPRASASGSAPSTIAPVVIRIGRSRSVAASVTAAAALRLRPILMTTGAMVLGSIPLAIASGAGAEARHQIGWVIVGGMSFGTMMTLFVVPVIYLLIARNHANDAKADHAA